MRTENPSLALLRSVGDVELELRTRAELTVHAEERDVQVRFRPVVALAIGDRLGPDPDNPPTTAAVAFVSDLVVSLSIDGLTVPTDRRLSLHSFVIVWSVVGAIVKAASEWNAQRIESGEVAQEIAAEFFRARRAKP